MGFIAKKLGMAAVRMAAQVADHHLEKNYSQKALMNKEKYEKSLFFDGHFTKHGGSFHIKTNDGTIKYTAKSSCWFHERTVTIYGKEKEELGSINLHLGVIHPSCSLYVNSENIGSIDMAKRTPPKKFDVNLKNSESWTIEGDVQGWHYNVINGENIVYHITHGYDSHFEYGLSYSGNRNELIGVMLLISIVLTNSTEYT